MISVKNLSAGYGSRPIIKDITVMAQPGQFIALVGPNGSGKSTLLKTICGLLSPSLGSADIGDSNIHEMPVKARAREMAYLAQTRFAAPMMSVEDVVKLGRAPYRGRLGKISAEGQTAIDKAIAQTQSTDLRHRRFDSLSGGEQARVLLTRALAVEASVLLADEPIAALDPYFQITMMGMLKAESQSGRTVIAALHDLPLAHQFCDQVWMMHEGRLFANGTPETVLTADNLKSVFSVTLPKGGFSSVSITD